MRLVSFICVILLLVCAGEGSAEEGSPGDRRPRACQRTTAGVEEVPPSEPRDVVVGVVPDEHVLTNGPGVPGSRAFTWGSIEISKTFR
jgi:hypothetical protein